MANAPNSGLIIGLGCSFFALDWIGYVPELEVQSSGTLFGFKIQCVLIPGLAILGSWAAFKFIWNITPEIREQVTRMENQKTASLSEEYRKGRAIWTISFLPPAVKYGAVPAECPAR